MGSSTPWRNGGLTPSLRARIAAEFEEVTTALDTAIEEPSPAAFDDLRDATDQLMRAAARIRLEIERLEQNRQ
jgi:hypothetical protein